MKTVKRYEAIRRCKCPCNRELPSRYKGREKIFYDSPNCRKVWHGMTPAQQKKRLREIQTVIEIEKKRFMTLKKNK